MSSSLYDCAVECLDPGETAAITTPPCPVCRGKQAKPRFSIGGMANRVVVCTECGLGSMCPQPSAEEIRDFYPPQYYGQTGAKFEPLVEMLVRLVATRHVRFLVRGLPRNARVLDVGCGRGVQLGALADRGFEVHGVEYSETAVAGADPRAQIRIACRLHDARYDSDYFDQVILWHVLEHLTHPRETLEEIHRILRPGGRLVVAVPNFSSIQANWAKSTWFHLDLPRHLFHFPLSALRRLLEECHLDCQSVHHFSLRQNPFGWAQSFQNRMCSLPRNGLYTLLQRSQGRSKPFTRLVRFRIRLTYLLGMPLGLLLSVLASVLRNGATVHVVAKCVSDKTEAAKTR